MAVVQREVVDDRAVDRDYDDEPVSPTADHGMNVAARIISFIGAVIISLLAVRFLLILFGASPLNGFANFIYSVSRPFVQPFFGLFGYDPTLGTRRFEYETLVAIIVYALLTWLLVKLVTLGKR